MRTVYPVGTTLYEPGKCFNGYTLIWYGGDVRLLDMNGRVVHRWQVGPEDIGQTGGAVPRAKLLPNGRLLVLFGGLYARHGGIAEYDWKGPLTWHYVPDAGVAHHDFFPKADGNVLLICREEVPENVTKRIADPSRQGIPIHGDVIIEVSRRGDVVWQWHQWEHLDINQCNPIPASRNWWGGPDNNTVTDWTHTNTVQALPENRWYDKGDARFRPGNVLMSLRQLDTILIVDVESQEVVWTYTGDYKGGMSGQHESCMIPKGMPGEGHILVFDNGASPYRNLAHAGCSYVLEIDPTTGKVAWVYDDGENFHSNFTSSTQRLPNGNTFICECTGRRLFEVTGDGRIVWEYVGEGDNRAYRYPYDHCRQTAALGAPAEVPVTPPAELRIPPDRC